MVEIPDVKHYLNFLSNVLPHLDYHIYTPIFFVQLKKDFHCEATYKQTILGFVILIGCYLKR